MTLGTKKKNYVKELSVKERKKERKGKKLNLKWETEKYLKKMKNITKRE